ncbi:MAG: hypothetical protein OXD31_14250 [Chloroflexi bacterium]|nr:hypothetical protein [Chloroflexota bacterium]
MKTTWYFDNRVLPRRPELRMEWIQAVLDNPVQVQIEDNGRVRRWGFIEERGRYLRVITEPDGETVHNAFLDRRFRPSN